MPLARNQAITIRRSFELEIESVNTRVYDTLNNGVYKAGFATSQTAYEEAVAPLFETLDWLYRAGEGSVAPASAVEAPTSRSAAAENHDPEQPRSRLSAHPL